MNQAQVKGKWEQIKGSAKKSWGKLTDDDFAKAEGSAEKLYGIIHEKFGDTKEAIKAKLEDVKDAIEAKVEDGQANSKELIETNVGRLETQLAQWGAKLDEMIARTVKVGAEVKDDYHKRLDDLKLKYHAAQQKLSESKAAGSEKWETFKHGVENAWSELEAAFKKMSN